MTHKFESGEGPSMKRALKSRSGFPSHELLNSEFSQAIRVFVERFSEFPQNRAKLRAISGNSLRAKVPDAIF